MEFDLKNYIKLEVLLSEAGKILRTEFLRRWKSMNSTEQWNDSSQFDCEFGHEVYMRVGRLQRDARDQGDLSNLNINTITEYLQHMGSDEERKSVHIQEIVEVRNKLAPHPTKSMTESEFNALWTKLSHPMLKLGFSKELLEKIYTAKNVAEISSFDFNSKQIDANNLARANALKNQGNVFYYQNQFQEAIDMYTQGIFHRGIGDELLGVLYSNRSAAYLKLGKDGKTVRNAVDDAKRGINARPIWWKSHYRLGLAYQAKDKHIKALSHYAQALEMGPNLEQLLLLHSAIDTVQLVVKPREEELRLRLDQIFERMASESDQEVNAILKDSANFWKTHGPEDQFGYDKTRRSFLGNFGFNELGLLVAEGSNTAGLLAGAVFHYNQAMGPFHKSNSVDYWTITHLAEAFRQEHMVVHMGPETNSKILSSIENEFKNYKKLEYNIRVCLLHLRKFSHTESIPFIEESLRIFPDKEHLYYLKVSALASLHRYDEGLQFATQALKKFPDDVKITYYKAVLSRLSTKCSIQDTCKAYEEFLASAPKDHPKVPESYYCMGLAQLQDRIQISARNKDIKADLGNLVTYYNLGLHAEKRQLQCFMPYQSKNKKTIERILELKNVDNQQVAKEIPCKGINQLQNPRINSLRISLAIEHRKVMKNQISEAAKHRPKITSTTNINPRKSSPHSTDFKRVTLQELDLGIVHDDHQICAIKLMCIEDTILEPSASQMLVEDERGDVRKCYINNISQGLDILKELVFGSKFLLLIPCQNVSSDYKPHIIIEEPWNLIMAQPRDLRGEICRFCLKDNAGFKCSRCNRVSYCSKSCQAEDWKTLKHKLICSNKIPAYS